MLHVPHTPAGHDAEYSHLDQAFGYGGTQYLARVRYAHAFGFGPLLDGAPAGRNYVGVTLMDLRLKRP